MGFASCHCIVSVKMRIERRALSQSDGDLRGYTPAFMAIVKKDEPGGPAPEAE
jgi:hypothetical protein